MPILLLIFLLVTIGRTDCWITLLFDDLILIVLLLGLVWEAKTLNIELTFLSAK